MKVLITGVNGFLGQNIVEEYLHRVDVEIVGIARNGQDMRIKCYETDVLDVVGVNKIFSENTFDIVIHLAALTEHSMIIDNKFESLNINMMGTTNLLNAFNKYCHNALFVYASTGKVYGNTNEMPISEQAITCPTNILGKSKLITERLIDFYVQPDNKYLITRIFNIYGGNQKENFIVPTIINQLKNKNHLCLGNTKDERDYLYINDFIRAFTLCIDEKEKLSNIEYINIGSGIPTSVNDIIHSFEIILGHKIEVTIDKNKFRLDETSEEYCNNSKLKKLTGWKPQYLLNDAISEICIEKGLL